MIHGIPNRSLYFYQKDIIITNPGTEPKTFRINATSSSYITLTSIYIFVIYGLVELVNPIPRSY